MHPTGGASSVSIIASVFLNENTARRNKIPLMMAMMAWPFLKLVELVAPQQMNSFGAVILKPDLKKDHYPWLTVSEDEKIRVNGEWLSRLYNKEKGAR